MFITKDAKTYKLLRNVFNVLFGVRDPAATSTKRPESICPTISSATVTRALITRCTTALKITSIPTHGDPSMTDLVHNFTRL